MGDACDMEYWIEIFERIVAGMIAERSLGAQLVQLDVAFENDLGGAGTSKSTVSHFTSSTGFRRRKPAMANSSTSGGAGTMAAKVTAGSVPMATATSILPPTVFPSGTREPPPERAMMSTAAEVFSCGSAAAAPRMRSR